MTKEIQNGNKVVKSLLALKDELENNHRGGEIREILFKINSCLYSEYPITGTYPEEKIKLYGKCTCKQQLTYWGSTYCTNDIICRKARDKKWWDENILAEGI